MTPILPLPHASDYGMESPQIVCVCAFFDSTILSFVRTFQYILSLSFPIIIAHTFFPTIFLFRLRLRPFLYHASLHHFLSSMHVSTSMGFIESNSQMTMDCDQLHDSNFPNIYYDFCAFSSTQHLVVCLFSQHITYFLAVLHSSSSSSQFPLHRSTSTISHFLPTTLSTSPLFVIHSFFLFRISSTHAYTSPPFSVGLSILCT